MDAIRRVHRGHSYIPQNVAQQLAQNIGNDILSPREIQVLLQVANGGKNRDIGRQLSITEETVKAHLSSILEKLGAKDRTQAVAIGVRRGIIQI
jgi:DNA-binding NarL/FixJ family response regulator